MAWLLLTLSHSPIFNYSGLEGEGDGQHHSQRAVGPENEPRDCLNSEEGREEGRGREKERQARGYRPPWFPTSTLAGRPQTLPHHLCHLSVPFSSQPGRYSTSVPGPTAHYMGAGTRARGGRREQVRSQEGRATGWPSAPSSFLVPVGGAGARRQPGMSVPAYKRARTHAHMHTHTGTHSSCREMHAVMGRKVTAV